MLFRSLLQRGGGLQYQTAAYLSTGGAKASTLVRGPSPGHGRSAWVTHAGVVYTVAYPFGYAASDGVGEQTRKALASLDERLAQAGTDKSNILDATVFLGDMSVSSVRPVTV